METSKVETPEASADGRRNAFYHTCRVVEQQRAFAACCARTEGRLSGDPMCEVAIGRSTCPALGMRKEELSKGVAIYFVERQRVEAFISTVKSWTAPSVRDEPVAAVPKKRDVMSRIEASQQDFADAVNKLIQKEQSAVTKMTVRPGESPLEAYRRIKGSK